jgi:hypothetical protein
MQALDLKANKIHGEGNSMEVKFITDQMLARFGHELIVPFLRQYGREYRPQPLPARFKAGAWRQCFANSYRMASRHKLTYVEGVAMGNDNDVPHLHAWCADCDRNVFDRTWKIGVAYFGIPFQLPFVKTTIEKRKAARGADYYYGILDDWHDKFPLINQFGDKPELWLAE